MIPEFGEEVVSSTVQQSTALSFSFAGPRQLDCQPLQLWNGEIIGT